MNIKLFFMFFTITMMFTFCTSSKESKIEKLPSDSEIKLKSIQVNIVTAEDSLDQSLFYNNPFSPTTEFFFDVEKIDTVTIEVFDKLGNPAAKPFHEKMKAGSYFFDVGLVLLKSGVYSIKFKIGENEYIKKAIMLK